MIDKVTTMSAIAIPVYVAMAGFLSYAANAQVNVERVGPTVPVLETLPQGLDVFLPVPENNSLTAAKVSLGEELFFDAKLSRDQSVSCASCHIPEKAFADGLAVSVGVDGRKGRRNAPSLLNGAYLQKMFWDGRAQTLEGQALQPLLNPAEMDNSFEVIVERLQSDGEYAELFEAAFGTAKVTIERVADAIASFERTLLSANSEFDRFLKTRDSSILSKAATGGLDLFRGKARCQQCHEHALLTDERFHNTGVSWNNLPSDLGRYEITGIDSDKGRFKTPSLRDVEHTAPYMHNGSIPTLEEVIDFYDQGGIENPYLDSSIEPLNLSDREKADLVAFLRTLSGSNWQKNIRQ